MHFFQQSETAWWPKSQKPKDLHLLQKPSARHSRTQSCDEVVLVEDHSMPCFLHPLISNMKIAANGL